MLNYEECKAIAKETADYFRVPLTKAYMLGEAYVFDTDVRMSGGLPVVVETDGGSFGLWNYINMKDLTMDDMVEIDFESGKKK